jgi:short-subunit dehydrogenase
MAAGIKRKAAVITGASSGIGRAVALALAVEHVSLCLIGRRADALQAVRKLALPTTDKVKVQQADLTSDLEIERLRLEIEDHFGEVDLLIHAAGVIELGLLESASVKSLDDQYRCNVRAPFALTQALLPMLKAAQGDIVFVNSTAGLEARARVGQYAATKHALKALTDSLREEVNPSGVRVLSLFLGRTATPMQEKVFRSEGKAYTPEKLLQTEDVARLLLSILQLPRTAEVTEVRVRPTIKCY